MSLTLGSEDTTEQASVDGIGNQMPKTRKSMPILSCLLYPNYHLAD